MMRRLHKKIKTSSEAYDKAPDIYAVLLPMILGICLCVACLVGSTLAWFNATQTTSIQKIQTANYDIIAEIVSNEAPVYAPNGVYELEAGKLYTVTLRAIGDASTGYCIISLENSEQEISLHHTVNFPIKSEPETKVLRFTITPTENVKMTLSPQWGSSSKNESEKWKGGENYPQISESNREPVAELVGEDIEIGAGDSEASAE